MMRKMLLAGVVLAIVITTATPAAAYRILDKDKAYGTNTAVAKAWSNGYGRIGFAIGTTPYQKVGYSWYINCPNADWWRSKHGTVTTGDNGVTWIVHPPRWTRCNETMKGWITDGSGMVVVIIGAG